MTKHTSDHEEDNSRTEKDDEQPEAEKTEAQIVKYTQFISFRKPKIDVAPIIEPHRCHSKRMIKASDIQVVRNIGNELARADCGQVWQPVTGTDPKFQGPIIRRLKKKDRVVLIAVGVEFVWHLSARKFRHFSHDPTVQVV